MCIDFTNSNAKVILFSELSYIFIDFVDLYQEKDLN